MAASLGMSGTHLSYYQKCSEQLQIGVDMDTSLRSGESVGAVGYAIEIPKSHMTFKGLNALQIVIKYTFFFNHIFYRFDR